MSDASLCFHSAVDLARMIRGKKVSAVEVMEAHLAQIARINPKVNAIVTMADEGQLLDQAAQADAAVAKGAETGPLHGLPLGVKDLVLTAGMRTTYGSRIYKDLVPGHDGLIVEREKAAGAIIVGKTNTPEFGAGGQTFNEVFGVTPNPYDLGKTCGGSSGGSAVALACGMLPLANGSDFGGSLRNPAAFCNVVGMRPSPGRVPVWPAKLGWFTLSVQGPMARTVGDLALYFSAIAGPDARAPIAIAEPPSLFAQPLQRDFKGVRIAWSRDLGYLPVDPVITQVCDAQRAVFEQLGCQVEDAHPDLQGASDVFKTLRAWRFALERGEELKEYRHLMKDTVIWNTEQGFKLDGPTVAKAEARRTEFYHRMREFLEDYEYLVLPCNPIPPFPVEQKTVTEIGGVKMATYVDAGALRHVITIVGNPAISVPCGFTPEGLPVGLQIVGRHQKDFELLQIAHAFEQATQFHLRRPPVVD
ncbi:MAG: amidase [SAR324 cluster bacterium]|nr:amidase [SAR324 cluster bacterium]